MFLFEIPGIKQLLYLFSDMKIFDNVVIFDIVVGAVLYLIVSTEKFPSGQLYTLLKPKIKKRIKVMDPKLGVVCMHFPAPLVFLYVSFFYPNGNPFSIPSLCFLAMTTYRAFIYPFFRNKYASVIPIKTVVLYNLISFNLGFCAAILLTFERRIFSFVGEIIVAALFTIVGIFVIIHDWILCREKSEKGYSIDHINTLLWKKITCPHYLLQFVQWCIWSAFIGSVGDSLSFLLPLAYLTISRADIIHGLMCQLIGPAYYLSGRKPCLPFVQGSKFFIQWFMRGF